MATRRSDSVGSRNEEARKKRQKDRELKRLRGEISCAECRRLKLKCDKKVPCSSCLRRGCQTICPNGVLAGGQGTRFVLADTESLHKKLNEMSVRIRQLEDALQIAHLRSSTGTHPLLEDHLLEIKHGIDSLHNREDDRNDEDGDQDEVVVNLGMLKISEGGVTRFLGVSGGSEGLIADAEDSDNDQYDSADLPAQIAQASQLFPFAPMYLASDELQGIIEAQLPSWERASALLEAYLQNLSWCFCAVDRLQLYEELLPAIYKRKKSPADGIHEHRIHPHDLALLLTVFSVGAAGDLTLKMGNEEAKFYEHLARAALGLRSVLSSASVSAVQAICLLGYIGVYIGRRSSLEECWKTISLGMSLASSVGLHRDPEKWGLEPKLVERRRNLFWEVLYVDNWQSLASGRPCSFSPSSYDVEFPSDNDCIPTADGRVLPSYRRWRARFIKDVLSHITDRICGNVAPLKYSEIMQLDRKIREFDDQGILSRPAAYASIPDHIQGCAVSSMKDAALLYIHRNFFASAITKYPNNPLASPFAPSFLSAYRSSTAMLKRTRDAFESSPALLLRLWPIWAHTLASSVVVGSVVTRCPTIALAQSAFGELELSIELFKQATEHPVVKHGLPVLLRMREKAYQAYTSSRASRSNQSLSPKADDSDDELAILRGTTRLIAKSPGSSKSRPGSLNSSPSSNPTGSFSPDNRLSPPLGDFHQLSDLALQSDSQGVVTELYGWASSTDSPAQNPPWLTATTLSDSSYPGSLFSNTQAQPGPSASVSFGSRPVNNVPYQVDETMLDAWNSCMRDVGFQDPEKFEMWL